MTEKQVLTLSCVSDSWLPACRSLELWVCYAAAEAYTTQGILPGLDKPLANFTYQGGLWKVSYFQGHLGLGERAVSGRLEGGKELFTQSILTHMEKTKG